MRVKAVCCKQASVSEASARSAVRLCSEAQSGDQQAVLTLYVQHLAFLLFSCSSGHITHMKIFQEFSAYTICTM